jgi:hypothetical protein
MFDKMKEKGLYLGSRVNEGKTTIWIVTEKMKSIKVKAPSSKTQCMAIFGEMVIVEALNAEIKFQKFNDSFIECETLVVNTHKSETKAAA